jgi:hypothetical protein
VETRRVPRPEASISKSLTSRGGRILRQELWPWSRRLVPRGPGPGLDFAAISLQRVMVWNHQSGVAPLGGSPRDTARRRHNKGLDLTG